MFANQFYQPDTYAPNDLAAAQLMARQLQTYTGTYGGTPANNSGLTSPASTVAQNPPNGNGPSANNRKLGLYKTELCRSWEEKGTCRYGSKCQFAHGEEELRKVPRHPKYKTEICRVRPIFASLMTIVQPSPRPSGSPDLAPTANGVVSSIPKSPLVEEGLVLRVLPHLLNPPDVTDRQVQIATPTILPAVLSSLASPLSAIKMPTQPEASTRLPLRPLLPLEDLRWAP